jgi:hypothetical protein
MYIRDRETKHSEKSLISSKLDTTSEGVDNMYEAVYLNGPAGSQKNWVIFDVALDSFHMNAYTMPGKMGNARHCSYQLRLYFGT